MIKNVCIICIGIKYQLQLFLLHFVCWMKAYVQWVEIDFEEAFFWVFFLCLCYFMILFVHFHFILGLFHSIQLGFFYFTAISFNTMFPVRKWKLECTFKIYLTPLWFVVTCTMGLNWFWRSILFGIFSRPSPFYNFSFSF